MTVVSTLPYSVISHSVVEFEPQVFVFDNDDDEANCCNVEQTLALLCDVVQLQKTYLNRCDNDDIRVCFYKTPCRVMHTKLRKHSNYYSNNRILPRLNIRIQFFQQIPALHYA